MSYKKLILTKSKGVATATLNRPECLNALDEDLHVDLHRAILESWDDPKVKVLVITGAGRAFCAGRDVSMQMAGVKAGHVTYPPKLSRNNPTEDVWAINLDIWNMPKPVIAAVNGVVVGGGLNVVLACDIILASDKASFGEFFIKKSMIASGGSTYLLPRLIGVQKAKEMLLTGDLYSAKDVERMGLVNYVYPAAEFQAKVKAFAEKLATGPGKAMGLMKRLVNEGLNRTLDEVGRDEMEADGILFDQYFNEVSEGILAHDEKRKPKFNI
jgi:2-(1,2-epoxy-1,2-dihydrophenyl)acetyl-CoA isomerase